MSWLHIIVIDFYFYLHLGIRLRWLWILFMTLVYTSYSFYIHCSVCGFIMQTEFMSPFGCGVNLYVKIQFAKYLFGAPKWDTELYIYFNSPLPPRVYLILRSYFNCFFIHILIISIYLAHHFNPGVISAAGTPPHKYPKTATHRRNCLAPGGRYSRCEQCYINNLGALALKLLMF